jgi:hypothetical protein
MEYLYAERWQDIVKFRNTFLQHFIHKYAKKQDIIEKEVTEGAIIAKMK